MPDRLAPGWEEAAEILGQAGVRFAIVLGSRTGSGRPRPNSDLDLAVDLPDPPGLLGRSRIAWQIAEAVRVPDVDLIVLGEAPLELKAKAIYEGELVYSVDEPVRVAFQVRTLSEFLDFEPTLRAHERRRLKQFAEYGLGH